MMDGHCGAIHFFVLGWTSSCTISQCRSLNKLLVYDKVYSKQLYI